MMFFTKPSFTFHGTNIRNTALTHERKELVIIVFEEDPFCVG